jgi:hypothetical protein
VVGERVIDHRQFWRIDDGLELTAGSAIVLLAATRRGLRMKVETGIAAAVLLALTACAPAAVKVEPAPSPFVAASSSTTEVVPEAVDGWREYALRDGVIKVQPAAWASETIDILVFGGDALEYKLGMTKGDAIVYSIDYGTMDPAMMVSEFHGHTEKGADGNGDLMFYSKADGAPQHGSFQAPWDGIHGWYLKNSSADDVVVKLKVAGFYQKLDAAK